MPNVTEANVTEEYIEKITISLASPFGVTVNLDDYTRSYVHQPHSPNWIKEKSSSTKILGFTAPTEYPHLGLPQRNGWEIINQQHLCHDGRAASFVVAEKDNHVVSIDLEDRLRGAKSSILDFLNIYRDCIHVYDP